MRINKLMLLPLAAVTILSTACKGTDPDNGNNGEDTPVKPEEPTEVTYGIPTCKGGWDIYKAGTYRYGPCFINNADGSIDAWFAATGDYHGMDKMLFNTLGSHNTPYQVVSGEAGQYFKIDKEFYAVQICCPTWNSTEESVTMSLYEWKGDYASTVNEEPFYSKRFVNFADNGWLTLVNGDEAVDDKSIKLPAGEYLWVATDPTAHAGIWVQDGDSGSTGGLSPKSFINGKEKSNYQFDSRILLEYTKAKVFWDQISYQHSEDGGKTWTAETFTLRPTEFSLDGLSCCDPGVAKWGGYYYLGYTSTEDERGTDNNVFVARSKNPDGPWEKWNGNGWGGNPEPVIKYHGIGNPDNFGAGEPCFVVLDGTVYFYYSWNDSGVQTRLSVASADDENWPANLEYKGVAIDKSDKSYDSADHSDVKYRPDLKKFFAVNTAKRMTENSFIQIWSSDNGIKFKLEGNMSGNGLKKGLHNCGWSGDEKGHQDPTKQQYIGYAYGLGTWGQWNTWFAPLDFPVKK